MPVDLRRLAPDDWAGWRDIRLRALADTPDAFGSTLELERTFTEADWRSRLSGATVVASSGGEPVGCGAVFENRPGHAAVVAMWVEPAYRGQGLSRRILDDLVGWARERGLTVEIGVSRASPTAHAARAAYESYGFVHTGRTHPLRPASPHTCDVLELPAP